MSEKRGIANKVRNFEHRLLNHIASNICRSPIAEAVMQNIIQKAGKEQEWQVDSAGIGDWHRGNPPDNRALNIMRRHGLPYSNRARQIKTKDFDDFDYIFGMDEENMTDLRGYSPKNCKAKLLMLGNYGLDNNDRIIKDPYQENGEAGFEKAYKQCTIACEAFFQLALAGKV